MGERLPCMYAVIRSGQPLTSRNAGPMSPTLAKHWFKGGRSDACIVGDDETGQSNM